MSTYFLYARKSTDEPDRQILSIEAQLAELQAYATRENLTISQTFIEKQTAKEPGRPVFNEMISLIEKGRADGILAWHPDRLARNSIDGGKIIYLIDKGKIKYLKFPAFWFDATPQGKFMLSIAFGQSKYYVDNLSENVKRGHRQKVRRGEYPGVAPTGYLNDQTNKKMIPDPERYHLIRKLFELYATGTYSLRELREIIFDYGLTSKAGKKLAIASIQRTLSNPFYYGAFVFNGELHAGIHQSCVSKKLFDDVQVMLKSKTNTKKRGVTPYPLRGLFSCGECGCAITSETQKGHVYYRCSKKKDGAWCSQKYVREEMLVEQIDGVIKKLSLPQSSIDWMLTELDRKEKVLDKSNCIYAQKVKGEIADIERKLDVLLDAHLENALSRDEYTAKKNKVLAEKLALEQKLRDVERRGTGWLELSRRFISVVNTMENVAKTGTIEEKRNFLKNAGSNRLLADRSAHIDFKTPWQILFDYTEKVGAPIGSIQTQNVPEGHALRKNFTDSVFLRQSSNVV